MRSKLMLKLANECKSIQAKTDISLPVNDRFHIYLVHSYSMLDADTQNKIITLFECLMKENYETSSWGYNRETKLGEFRHQKTRFILLTENRSDEGDKISKKKLSIDITPRNDEEIVAFMSFRFEVGSNKAESALYVYELHVNPKHQQQGIGTALMNLAYNIARSFNMDKIMLTVLRNNNVGLKFYQKMKFRPDESNPAKNEADYNILSLKVKR